MCAVHRYQRFGTAVVAAILAAASVTSRLGAQQPAKAAAAPPTVITFDQALKLALTQNTGIKQAQNTAALNSAAVAQSKLAFLPNLSISANTAQNYDRNFSQTDGQIINTTTNTLNTGLASSVTLFDGMKNVANLKSAQLDERAGEEDLSRAKQTAVFTVASNYLVLVTQQQQLAVQQQNL